MSTKNSVISLLVTIATLTTIRGDNCPSRCRCYPNPNQRAVVCDGSGYTELPNDLPSWTEDLDMSNNQITQLDPNAFVKFPKLRVFKIKRNSLKSIPEGLFRNNPVLRDVDFSANDIVGVPKDLFKYTTALQYLKLDDNKITKLDGGVFRTTRAMKSLT